MSLNKKIFCCFILILILSGIIFLIPSPARADIAPPAQPPGANPFPQTDLTRVRMVAETVLIDIVPNPPTDSLGQAKVTADFTMQNVGDISETMAVRFPISVNDGFFNYPEITDLQVEVNAQVVTTRTVEIPNEFDDPIRWAEFDVTFPAGQVVRIKVTYTLEATGEYPYLSFAYLLETGAGWNDTIGEAEIIVRLPYETNEYNVIFNQQIGWSETTPGGTLTGNEVHWVFEDLEPTSQDNFQVSLVLPSAWQQVLVERENVAQDLEDGEAWGRLGKIYKEISRLRKGLREDLGGQDLYQLSQEAYEQAITLLPDDALWHAGYADLLWTHYYYYEYFLEQPDTSELIHILQLLDRSLALSPGNSVAFELLTSVSFAIPEAVQFNEDDFTIHYLTVTPIIELAATTTPLPTDTPLPTTTLTPLPQNTATAAPTSTPHLTETPIPTQTATPIPSPTPTIAPVPTDAPSGIQFCGLPLLIFIPALRRRKKH